jgi:hypothetical protein
MTSIAVSDRHPPGTRGQQPRLFRACSEQPGVVSLSSVPAGCRALSAFMREPVPGRTPSGVVA